MFIAKLIPSKFFSLQARKPSGWFGRFFMSRLFNKGNADLNHFIKELLDLQKSDKVLEVGYGPGKLINEIASITTKGIVEGIDFSEAMYTEASRINSKYIADNRVKLLVGNCDDMPYENGSFDKICTSNTLYFWDDPDKVLKEMLRIIKGGGKIVVGFRDKEHMDKLPLSDDVFNTYSSEEVAALLSNAGFADVVIEKIEGGPFVSYCAVATKA
jgi:ubiquinone/menaquinone biosynthesis C-methylase UbiE